MSSVDKEKLGELLGKIKTLGNRVKEVRSEFGQPLVDRVGTRLDKLLTRLPQQDGDSKPHQPQPEARRTCPKCGQSFADDIAFCSTCGFDFKAEQRRQQREQIEGEKIERTGRIGIST